MPPGGLVKVASKVNTTEDRTRAKAAHTTFQFSLDVSTPEGLATVPEQIRLALKANKGRVIDFFQSMDDDGSGTISRKEFILELSELGLSDYQEQVAQVFDYLDGNGSGSLDYTELSAMLRGSKPLPVGGGKTQKEAEWWLRKVPEDVRQVSSPYLPVVISSNRRLQGGSIHAWQFTPEVFVGTNRCSSKLAIIMHAAHASTMLSQPTPGGRVLFPSSVLRSDFVQRHLVSEGYGVLAFEAHAFGATWDEAGEGATAALLAVFEYVSRHVQLRYCRVAVFASGVGATAALVASSRVPALFEQRLKLVCAYEPALERTSRGLWGEGSRALDDGTLPVMEDQTAVTADQLEAELLSQCVPRLQVFYKSSSCWCHPWQRRLSCQSGTPCTSCSSPTTRRARCSCTRGRHQTTSSTSASSQSCSSNTFRRTWAAMGTSTSRSCSTHQGPRGPRGLLHGRRVPTHLGTRSCPPSRRGRLRAGPRTRLVSLNLATRRCPPSRRVCESGEP